MDAKTPRFGADQLRGLIDFMASRSGCSSVFCEAEQCALTDLLVLRIMAACNPNGPDELAIAHQREAAWQDG